MYSGTGRTAAEALENFLNSASKNDRKDFAEYLTLNAHRTLQQCAMGLFLKCIENWADLGEKGCSDLRNEATTKLSKKICDAFDKYDRALPFI